ncbi:hypothetical protein ANT2_4266 [plant metagenome]|uniref:Uncharacterized protein n=1 Tax=plant metagenome TaxID=1297885 RepID=A0A484TBT3_9ZZZZ
MVAARKQESPRRAFGLLPPEGAVFCLGTARRQKGPPRCAFGLLPPEGAVFCLGTARRQKGPVPDGQRHCVQLLG